MCIYFRVSRDAKIFSQGFGSPVLNIHAVSQEKPWIYVLQSNMLQKQGYQ